MRSRPGPMLTRIFLTCFITLQIGTTCLAAASSREEALILLVRFREQGALRILPEEYGNLEETFAKAELLLERKGAAEADEFFRLTLLKGQLFQKRLDEALRDAREEEQATAAEAEPTREDVPALVAEQQIMESLREEPKQEEAAAEQTATSEESFPASDKIVGEESVYVVKKRESLKMAAARLGVGWQRLAKLNGLDPKRLLEPGQEVRYNNRRIIPKMMKTGVVVNIPDRTLYYFRSGRLARALPVAVGMPNLKNDITWRTPTGNFKITAKTANPAWHVPPSIRAQMEQQGKEAVVVVPPGKNNPLGKYAIRTSIPGIMIHSTNLPASIYGFNSHGCIRVMPQQMEQFFKEIAVNTPGEIIYKPVKLAVTESGRVLLEVHTDVYKKYKNLEDEAKKMIAASKVASRVDWAKVRELVKTRTGIAEDVTLPATAKKPKSGETLALQVERRE